MKQLILVQHCQSEQHLNGMVGGATDWPLTAPGREQAERLGAALRAQLPPQSDLLLYSSDLARARQTAEVIARHLGTVPVFRQDLREQDLGGATGKTQAWFRDNQLPLPDHAPLIYHRYLPDAETGAEVYDRVSGVVREIEGCNRETVIVVGHGGSLQMFAACWLKLPVTALEQTALIGSAGGVSFLSIRWDGVRVLNRWNDLSYVH